MRILGLDYGSKTVGVAVCDPLGMTAQGVETITRKEENKLRKTLARSEALVEEYQVETIVLGYPKNMDDSIGERALKTEEFRNMLVRRTGLPVVLWDERLTTIEANEILIESGVRREDRKKVIDKIAATLILQSYLGSLKQKNRRETVMEEKITLQTDTGESVDFYVLEETRINGMNYLLVTDSEEEEDGECYILKDVSKAEDSDAVYEFVENDDEMDYLFKIFTELMEDMEVELQK